MENVFELNNIHKSYQGESILKDFSLQLKAGCCYGFLGRNGAGKSTAIKILMGMTQFEQGEVKLLGQDPWEIDRSLKAQVGYVSQTQTLPPTATAAELIIFHQKMYPNWRSDYVDMLLTRFEINKNKKVKALSGGMQKLLAIILALGQDPTLLILDEPTVGLDPISKQELMDNLLELLLNENSSIFFSSHILADIEKLADKIGILKGGKLVIDMELDTLKVSVKQIQLDFSDDIPPSFDIPGLLSIKKIGRSIILTIKSDDQNIVETIKNKYSAKIKLLDMNLEEIFIELAK